MFKTLMALLILCFSTSSFSKDVELKIKMTLRNEEKTEVTRETKVIATLGRDFEIPFTDGKSFKMKMNVADKFEIPAEIKKHHQGMMKSDLMIRGEIFIKENGSEKLIASPQIMSNYKTEAIFEVMDDNGEHFEMRVTPTAKI